MPTEVIVLLATVHLIYHVVWTNELGLLGVLHSRDMCLKTSLMLDDLPENVHRRKAALGALLAGGLTREDIIE